MPVVAPTDATGVNPLVQEPPAIAFVKLIVDDTQTVDGPPITEGNGFTVKNKVAAQPVGNV
jgi:hypothetical protein